MQDHEHDHDHHGHEHEPVDYASWLAEQREDKDAYFRDSHHSPLPAGERAGFGGLPYYPVDLAFRYEGLQLQALSAGLDVETRVQTSDGAQREGRRVGALVFDVAGQEQRLTALQLANSHGDTIFVPFRDATSGAGTYAAGRYLDIERMPDGSYDLDFNLAYSPFCAYSPSYSCPLPPAENRLAAHITAGERET